ncbi:MAG TPA: hypothetical protein VFH94_20865 [Streptomyces sp.]|nr:hypothetical protein [Streptomyces sp.]
MLAFVAAALFFIAFILHATETSTEVLFSPMSLMLFGLSILAVHLAGVGANWTGRGRRR